MSKYTDAFTQVYVILKELEEEDYKKIPQEVVSAIEKNRNKEYEFELDESRELKDQDLLPESRALLFKIYRDYLATPEQKQKIIKMQNEERAKKELKKKQQYNTNVFTNKGTETIQKSELENETELQQQLTQIVSYKESFLKRFFNRIRGVFKKQYQK